jgi:hypothetical protein
MKIRSGSFVPLLLALATTVGCSSLPPPSPYVGEQGRAIKALSQKEASDLLAGAGMGYAKAAELNGYPGPSHVLDLAPRLELSASQQTAIEAILKDHKAEARRLGAEVVRLEARLDALFASGSPSPENVGLVVGQLAATSGLLRSSHLTAHVATTRVLTREQVTRYVALRGYGEAHPGH